MKIPANSRSFQESVLTRYRISNNTSNCVKAHLKECQQYSCRHYEVHKNFDSKVFLKENFFIQKKIVNHNLTSLSDKCLTHVVVFSSFIIIWLNLNKNCSEVIQTNHCYSYVLMISLDHQNKMTDYFIYQPLCSDDFIRSDEIIRSQNSR